MAKIKKILARQVLDSRGNPTVEAEVYLDDNLFGRAIVPSGASTGTREALELRDKDAKIYKGKSVLKAVANVNEKIAPKLIGQDVEKQEQIDKLMIDLDGTENKSNLGANAILSVSMASACAASKFLNIPLFAYIGKLFKSDDKKLAHLGKYQANSLCEKIMPLCMMNILNGGEHASNNLDIQEFMIVPVGAKNMQDAVRMGAEVFHELKSLLKSMNLSVAVGDEGGFAPNLNSGEEAINLILKAIKNAGYKEKQDIQIALDCAASEFFKDGKYNLKGENKIMDAKELIAYYENLVSKYPIFSIEDALAETDWASWAVLTEKLKDKTQLVGDDVFVTNPKIFEKGIKEKIGNAILIKLNQIGTLTETLQAIKMAKDAGYSAVISHRSGETEDSFIADLAVGTCAGQIKTGSLSRSDRIAKYNQLLRIEETLSQISI